MRLAPDSQNGVKKKGTICESTEVTPPLFSNKGTGETREVADLRGWGTHAVLW